MESRALRLAMQTLMSFAHDTSTKNLQIKAQPERSGHAPRYMCTGKFALLPEELFFWSFGRVAMCNDEGSYLEGEVARIL